MDPAVVCGFLAKRSKFILINALKMELAQEKDLICLIYRCDSCELNPMNVYELFN